MDMNWRLTRAGAEARVALEPHVFHEQWRSRADLPAHFRGYTVGLCGFAAKHLLTGDVSAGLYLFAARARGILRRVKAGIQGRSWLQLRIAAAEAAGYLEGSWRGLRRRW
jgi:hypothetical protein